MPPAMLDLTPDFNPATATPAPSNGPSSSAATTPAPARRTLLLAPPSIAAREDRLGELFAVHPRSSTDLQMLDRLAAGLVTLPPATYDLVLVLTDPDGSRRAEAAALLRDRAVWSRLAPAIRPGGLLRCEDGSLAAGDAPSGLEAAGREAVLAGLVAGAEGFTKPEYAEEEVVPLRLGLKKKKKEEEEEGDGSGGSSAGVNGAAAQAGAKSSAGPAAGAVTVSVDGKKEELAAAAATTAAPAGVGFVDFSDDLDLDADDDDNVIDEETLLTEEDLRRPIQQPPECRPQPGKKRRACKDWYVCADLTAQDDASCAR